MLLATLYAISFVDRSILSLLTAPLTADLGLSDRQLGLLLGPAFAVLYCLIGLPMAHWIDLNRRIRIVVLGVSVWSLATLASAWAGSFAALLACRAGVAVGEAVLTPAALSIVADLFGPARRRQPTAIYLATGTLMTGGAALVGAIAVDAAQHLHAQFGLPTPWRTTLMLVGLPGLVVAALLGLTVREPPRAPVTAATGGVEFNAFVRHLTGNRSFYIPYHLGLGLGAMLGLGMLSWAPTVLVREHGMSAARAGYIVGAASVPAAAIGTFFWSWLSGRLDRAGRAGPLIALSLAAAVGGIAALAAALSSGVAGFAAAVSGISLSVCAYALLAALVLQEVGPPRMRGRLSSLVILWSNLLGIGVGPLAVAQIAASLRLTPAALSHAIGLLGATVAPAAVVTFCFAATAYGRMRTRARSISDQALHISDL